MLQALPPEEAVSQILQADPDGVFESVNMLMRTLVADTVPDVLVAGRALLGALALILAVWTGLRQAFGDGWDPWAYIQLVIAVLFPLAMLQAYDQPLVLVPGVPITLPGSADPLTFPELVVAQGGWLAQAINEDGFADFWAFVRSLGGKLAEMLLAGAAGGVTWWNPLSWAAGVAALTVTVPTLAVTLLAFLVAMAAAIVGYAQVILAHVAIGVLVVFGPILIPWMLMDKMAFLFWGWLRSMITYSFYAAVAAALLRVMLALLAGCASRVMEEVNIAQLMSGSLADALQNLQDATFWLVTLVVASLAALASFFQIPAIAGGIVSGAAGGASLLEGMATLAAAGRVTTRVAAAAAKAPRGGSG